MISLFAIWFLFVAFDVNVANRFWVDGQPDRISTYYLTVGKIMWLNIFNFLPLLVVSILCIKRNYLRFWGIIGFIALLLGAIGICTNFSLE